MLIRRISIGWLSVAVLAVCVQDAAARAPAEQYETLQLDGGPTLPRLAGARRVERLGRVEVYAISLHGPIRMPDLFRLSAPDVPKALRVDVQYDPAVRPRIPIDWRRELVPNLNPAAVSSLQRAFAALQAGDVVLVAYIPEKGTEIRLNKSTIVKEGDHDVMLAFLDHWLGQRPVSEEIKNELMAALRTQ